MNFVKADATSYLYHYTSERCSNRIVETGVIRASLNENTLFGHGVYLSPLSPDYGKKAILFNNYGQYRKWYSKYKVVCYFKIKKNQLRGAYCRAMNDGRVIWRYPNRNIVLSQVDYEFGYTDPYRNVHYHLKQLIQAVQPSMAIEYPRPQSYYHTDSSSNITDDEPQQQQRISNESYQNYIRHQTSQIVYSSSPSSYNTYSYQQPPQRDECEECIHVFLTILAVFVFIVFTILYSLASLPINK